jgi:hypothetical protein
VLADADHVSVAALATAAARGVELLAPVPTASVGAVDSAPSMRALAAQMAAPAAQAAYRARKALSEYANAVLKDRFGLRRLPVRGLEKVTCVMLLAAIVFNVIQHAAAFARGPP